MLSVKPLLPLILALMFSVDSWARGGEHSGGGWHGTPGMGGLSGYRGGGFGWSWRFGGRPFIANRHFYYPGWGFSVGAYPYWPSYSDYWPYFSYGSYYYATDIAIPSSRPLVYIEQSSVPHIQALEPGEWQYCTNPEGYYPHLKECPVGWQKLDAQPEGQPLGYWYYCDLPAGYYPYVRECTLSWRQIVP